MDRLLPCWSSHCGAGAQASGAQVDVVEGWQSSLRPQHEDVIQIDFSQLKALLFQLATLSPILCRLYSYPFNPTVTTVYMIYTRTSAEHIHTYNTYTYMHTCCTPTYTVLQYLLVATGPASIQLFAGSLGSVSSHGSASLGQQGDAELRGDRKGVCPRRFLE